MTDPTQKQFPQLGDEVLYRLRKRGILLTATVIGIDGDRITLERSGWQFVISRDRIHQKPCT